MIRREPSDSEATYPRFGPFVQGAPAQMSSSEAGKAPGVLRAVAPGSHRGFVGVAKASSFAQEAAASRVDAGGRR
jgi:hypothetical protein